MQHPLVLTLREYRATRRLELYRRIDSLTPIVGLIVWIAAVGFALAIGPH